MNLTWSCGSFSATGTRLWLDPRIPPMVDGRSWDGEPGKKNCLLQRVWTPSGECGRSLFALIGCRRAMRTVPRRRVSTQHTSGVMMRVGEEAADDGDGSESVDDLFREIWERESQPELRFGVKGVFGSVRYRVQK